jgi:hypothetical protein
MKLLAAGLALIATGLALVVLTDLNPAALFIGGIACTFLGIISLLRLLSGLGAGTSASDTTDAVDLVLANDRDSARRGAQGFNDHI